MEAYLLKHAFVTIFLFPSILAGVSRVGQSDQCVFLVAISVRSRTSDPSAQKDGQMALEGLLLRSGICLGWFSWLDLQTWMSPAMWIGENHRMYLLWSAVTWMDRLGYMIYRTIVSNFMFSSIPTKAKSLLAFGLLDLQISSPWARQHEVPQSNEIYDFIIFRGKGGDMSRQKWLQCDCGSPVHKPWTKETTVLIETCEASALNSKKLFRRKCLQTWHDRKTERSSSVTTSLWEAKTWRTSPCSRDWLNTKDKAGCQPGSGFADSPNTSISSVFPGWLWRPPATAGYGPAPTRDNYMGMGGWNGGMACGRVWQKVGKSLGFRMFWEGLRLLEVWPKPKSDESTWFSLCFFLILSLGLDELLLLCIARPFDLQQAQHRVCWTSQRRQTNCNAVSNVNVRICFIQCCTGISHQLFIHWICKN